MSSEIREKVTDEEACAARKKNCISRGRYLSTTVGQIIFSISSSFSQNTLLPPPDPPATPITNT
eukprot:41814-Rhodomonas_salina.1